MEPIFKACWNKEKCECGVETLRLMGALISMKASSYLKFQCVCDPRTWGKKALPLCLCGWFLQSILDMMFTSGKGKEVKKEMASVYCMLSTYCAAWAA